MSAERCRDNGRRVGRTNPDSDRMRHGRRRRFVVVLREIRGHLIGYAWVVAFRELLRTPRIPVEIRRGSVILAGLLTSPFVISAFAWWVLTGKRLPGPFGAWLDPAVMRVNVFRKVPATLFEDSTTPGPPRD